tara:strand:+ start:117495 stop:119555 length:2061 start_codon:yes stop_codon:yes gene_type:complete
MKEDSMFKQNISFDVWGGESGKYRLKDANGNNIDESPQDTCFRVAKALALGEEDPSRWEGEFASILGTRFAGGGRIMANIGAQEYKKDVSPINCTVMRQIPDSMSGIMNTVGDAALALKSGCGVGYDFSTIRPKGSHVFGAGAETSGVISFMKIFDATCATVMSGGGRRGAQMGCLDIQHPEVESFISCKREAGMLRYFNLSVLITDAFMTAVENNEGWDLWFWEKDSDYNSGGSVFVIEVEDIPFNHPEEKYFSFSKSHAEVLSGNCDIDTVFKKTVFKTVRARELFDLIMESTYDFAEPGFILIDRINKENNLWFVESIRATNPCGEQPLAPNAACLLGSMILTSYVRGAFKKKASFDWDLLKRDVRVANRLLDNVVDVNNLPLEEMREQIISKRRHGLGFTGLGSVLNMLGMRYGSEESVEFSEKISLVLASESLLESINIAEEKGCAPVLKSKKSREMLVSSGYMKRLLGEIDADGSIKQMILKNGLRWSHATSIAPTGTLSLTWGNNCSNGIEPSFSNSYLRNVRVSGKKTKVQEEVCSYEYYLWKDKFGDDDLPTWWSITDDLETADHVRIQAAVQKWCDSSISKTINVPADFSFDKFKDVYISGWKSGLKGVTTFRFNPEAFSGVLVRKEDLENTQYSFTLSDGSEVTVCGSDTIEYDGEMHNAANLFDALKEGIYGDM